MSSAGCFERIGTSSRGMTPEQIQKRMIASFKADLKITNLPANKRSDIQDDQIPIYSGRVDHQ